ncbi:MAG: ribose-phosphate pyrophosphokinase [Pseudomonadota bacterium]|nr:ribose-phosphate pyrophosphokinase [Pseudomonadota bacterium]
MADSTLTIFSGNACPDLARSVCQFLGIRMGRCVVDRFTDGEVMVDVIDNVRGKDVFIVQSTCAPGNENLMELLIMVDAMKRASAARVTAVMPYMGYSRQDRRLRKVRGPISAKVVAKLIGAVGTDRALTIDLHADQIQGFYDIPIDNVYASPVLLGDIWRHNYDDPVVVSPDVGGVIRARALARPLDDADLAIIDKRRPQPGQTEVMNIIGEVAGRTCIIIDDIVDTAGTLCRAADALKEQGATKVVAYITHAVLSGKAVQNIGGSSLDEVVVTDTIPLGEAAAACAKIRQLSIAELLAETIRRISDEDSVSTLYLD